jgi:hypothetical protein
MASRKSLSVEEAIEFIYNDSGDELTPELDSSDGESGEGEPAVSGAVRVIIDLHPTSQPM